ncbi:MAG TPA: hypothetical protein PLN19_08190 [Methanothrix sp.]|nr:hypothetical protein [Methanothrix sp.]HPC90112.1 hypothetical protein [Methanothrix sp.]HQE88234.1 hypothetical protein [Methanothrix sp.]HQI67273.1 hypothetical protein [Methanothrix sp.]HRS84256.1 hypothetical protein [Methanothrix sp.]
MKTMIAVLSLLLCLLLPAAMPAGGYEYHMPVNIEYTITPSVLLPGDEAMLAIEMANGAASYGAGEDAGAATYSQGTVLSTPLNHTTLHSTPQIVVMEEDHWDLGMIGPSDRVTVYYKIRARDNITSGTHLLSFEVVGGYDQITLHREIPVKVDDTSVSLARAEVSATSFNLNVANPRENTLNAVTIVPSADEITFSPDEYYIGTMDPDEVFTISFAVKSKARAQAGPVNLTFYSKFKNGDNWHRSEEYVTTYTAPQLESKQSSYLLPAGAAALVVIVAGGYLYRRRRSQRTIP